ncbi:MAG: M28 family peptidase, partial [Candidatus Aminicenantia bacterium]
LRIVEELDSYYIAILKYNEIKNLKKYNFKFSIAEQDISGKEFFLVYSTKPEDIQRLSYFGNAIRIESNTILFWKAKGERLLIPPEYQRKLLSYDSINEFLKIPSEVEIIEEPTHENEVVRKILDEVSSAQLIYFVDTLQKFQTRYSSTKNCEDAGDFIYNYFENLGLKVQFQYFNFSKYTSRNIVAEIKGKTYPEDIFIICAHYDSTSNIPEVFAPGADDNASGISAVLESARILSKYPLDFTVRFACFSAEEWGLYGSRAYANLVKNKNERVIGVLNFDMIAYADRTPEDLEIIVNPNSEWLALKAIEVSHKYFPYPLRKIVSSSFVYSDHASFWEKGYSSFCAIEDNPIRNPYYHKIYDTLETLNIDFLASATKIGLSLLSDLAQPIRSGYPKTPTGLKGKYVIYRSLFNSIKNVFLTWDSMPDAIGYNVYRTTTTRLNYKKLNSIPISINYFKDSNLQPEKTYYYVVTSINSSELESNYSREVSILPEKSLNQYFHIFPFQTGIE